MGLDLSGNGSSETMYDKGDRNQDDDLRQQSSPDNADLFKAGGQCKLNVLLQFGKPRHHFCSHQTHHNSLQQQQQQQPFNGRLSGTTRVGRYQKKHSPAHTHPGQRTSFITFLHLQRSTASSLFSLQPLSRSSLVFLLALDPQLHTDLPCQLHGLRWSSRATFITL